MWSFSPRIAAFQRKTALLQGLQGLQWTLKRTNKGQSLTKMSTAAAQFYPPHFLYTWNNVPRLPLSGRSRFRTSDLERAGSPSSVTAADRSILRRQSDPLRSISHPPPFAVFVVAIVGYDNRRSWRRPANDFVDEIIKIGVPRLFRVHCCAQQPPVFTYP